MVDVNQLDLSISPPAFVPLAAEILGDAATPADGFDAILTQAVEAFGSGDPGLAAMDLDLALVEPAAAVVVENTLVADTLQLGHDLDTGAGVVTDFGNLLTGTGAPAPPPIVPPSVTGGGGLTGGDVCVGCAGDQDFQALCRFLGIPCVD